MKITLNLDDLELKYLCNFLGAQFERVDESVPYFEIYKIITQIENNLKRQNTGRN